MVDFSIESNIKQFKRAVKYHQRQIPFATAKALNATTADARLNLFQKLRGRQKSNKQWWKNRLYGVLRDFAKPKRLVAAIFTNIYWAKLQEVGGTKRPHKGKSIAVPTSNVPMKFRKSGGARDIFDRAGVFVMKGTKPGVTGIWQRKSKKRIVKLFSFASHATINRPILHFKETVAVRIRRKFPRFHRDEMVRAIKTAKKVG